MCNPSLSGEDSGSRISPVSPALGASPWSGASGLALTVISTSPCLTRISPTPLSRTRSTSRSTSSIGSGLCQVSPCRVSSISRITVDSTRPTVGKPTPGCTILDIHDQAYQQSPMSIRVLDPRVAQQVAAGEVVDRPASVVKELAENSLDAGATRVEVELGEGGTSHILVRDDGSGMPPEDASAAVLRHATRKIRSVKDIESVRTLGFRGEALPSIASVSSFTLTTSTGEGAGTKVVVEGGGEAEVSPTSHPKGTTVLVDRLFYNVPARRAFLKGPRAERAAITEVLTHLAIAHPNVAFRLTEKGRDYLSLPAAGDLLERLAQIHGVAKARAMRKVEYESGAFEIFGYAALPSLTEGSRAHQTISVNGRFVKAENLHRGLDDAYRATVPGGRYPPVALEMHVDPRRVDVNVHPTKQVVRFSEERAARDSLAAAVRAAIER